MDTPVCYEIPGYLSSLLIAVSLMMSVALE